MCPCAHKPQAGTLVHLGSFRATADPHPRKAADFQEQAAPARCLGMLKHATCYTCHLFISSPQFDHLWLLQLEGKFQGTEIRTRALFCGNTLKCREETTRRKLSSADVAIFGGINFGDRFGSWRDFAVRLEGDADVSELLSSLGWMPYSLGTLPAL